MHSCGSFERSKGFICLGWLFCLFFHLSTASLESDYVIYEYMANASRFIVDDPPLPPTRHHGSTHSSAFETLDVVAAVFIGTPNEYEPRFDNFTCSRSPASADRLHTSGVRWQELVAETHAASELDYLILTKFQYPVNMNYLQTFEYLTGICLPTPLFYDIGVAHIRLNKAIRADNGTLISANNTSKLELNTASFYFPLNIDLARVLQAQFLLNETRLRYHPVNVTLDIPGIENRLDPFWRPDQRSTIMVAYVLKSVATIAFAFCVFLMHGRFLYLDARYVRQGNGTAPAMEVLFISGLLMIYVSIQVCLYPYVSSHHYRLAGFTYLVALLMHRYSRIIFFTYIVGRAPRINALSKNRSLKNLPPGSPPLDKTPVKIESLPKKRGQCCFSCRNPPPETPDEVGVIDPNRKPAKRLEKDLVYETFLVAAMRDDIPTDLKYARLLTGMFNTEPDPFGLLEPDDLPIPKDPPTIVSTPCLDSFQSRLSTPSVVLPSTTAESDVFECKSESDVAEAAISQPTISSSSVSAAPDSAASTPAISPSSFSPADSDDGRPLDQQLNPSLAQATPNPRDEREPSPSPALNSHVPPPPMADLIQWALDEDFIFVWYFGSDTNSNVMTTKDSSISDSDPLSMAFPDDFETHHDWLLTGEGSADNDELPIPARDLALSRIKSFQKASLMDYVVTYPVRGRLFLRDVLCYGISTHEGVQRTENLICTRRESMRQLVRYLRASYSDDMLQLIAFLGGTFFRTTEWQNAVRRSGPPEAQKMDEASRELAINLFEKSDNEKERLRVTFFPRKVAKCVTINPLHAKETTIQENEYKRHKKWLDETMESGWVHMAPAMYRTLPFTPADAMQQITAVLDCLYENQPDARWVNDNNEDWELLMNECDADRLENSRDKRVLIDDPSNETTIMSVHGAPKTPYFSRAQVNHLLWTREKYMLDTSHGTTLWHSRAFSVMMVLTLMAVSLGFAKPFWGANAYSSWTGIYDLKPSTPLRIRVLVLMVPVFLSLCVSLYQLNQLNYIDPVDFDTHYLSEQQRAEGSLRWSGYPLPMRTDSPPYRKTQSMLVTTLLCEGSLSFLYICELLLALAIRMQWSHAPSALAFWKAYDIHPVWVSTMRVCLELAFPIVYVLVYAVQHSTLMNVFGEDDPCSYEMTRWLLSDQQDCKPAIHQTSAPVLQPVKEKITDHDPETLEEPRSDDPPLVSSMAISSPPTPLGTPGSPLAVAGCVTDPQILPECTEKVTTPERATPLLLPPRKEAGSPYGALERQADVTRETGYAPSLVFRSHRQRRGRTTTAMDERRTVTLKSTWSNRVCTGTAMQEV